MACRLYFAMYFSCGKTTFWVSVEHVTFWLTGQTLSLLPDELGDKLSSEDRLLRVEIDEWPRPPPPRGK